MTRFWLGGYGADMQGDAAGIGLLAGDDGRAPTTLAHRGVAAALASPSWLAQHPTLDVVYAALEGEGSVVALARSGEATLRQLGPAMPVGDAVCHIAVAPNGSSLVASCYGDGRVVHVGLDAAGRMLQQHAATPATDPHSPDALLPEGEPFLAGAAGLLEGGIELGAAAAAVDAGGHGAHSAHPRVSHAHTAAFLPAGRVVTTDLGFDTLRLWHPTAAGLVPDGEVVLPRGVGPRHVLVHPSGHLHVVTEYSCEVFTLALGVDRRWSIVASTTVSPAAMIGVDFPAEISRSRDAETLYVGVRGSNTIAALRVRDGGARVEPLALADAGVDWPRHHLVHDDLLLVAGQRSDEVAVLDLDARTGVPGRIRHRASAPSPTHILPVA